MVLHNIMNDLARMKDQIKVLLQEKEEESITMRDLMDVMKREYSKLESDLGGDIKRLESQVADQKSKIDGAAENLRQDKVSRKMHDEEKDKIIEDLTIKLTYTNIELHLMVEKSIGKIVKMVDEVQWDNREEMKMSKTLAKKIEDFQLTRLALRP